MKLSQAAPDSEAFCKNNTIGSGNHAVLEANHLTKGDISMEDAIAKPIAGMHSIGYGDKFDADKLGAHPFVEVIILLGNTSHFHWAKCGEYVI